MNVPPLSGHSELARRTVAALVMASLALGAAWSGGWPFAVFWILAGCLVFWEWQAIIRSMSLTKVPPTVLAAGAMALVGAGLSVLLRQPVWGAAAFLAGLLGLLLQARSNIPGLTAAGLFYALGACLPVVILRLSEPQGFAAVLFLFAVVWGSDVMAYFVGRAVGGPKLWPRISPKKTWSGFLGGALSGGALAAGVAAAFQLSDLGMVFLLGVLLSIASQGGDLFESSLKRRFGVKDASNLIPGHGGVMDRLDGFIAAASLAVLIGAARAWANPAGGLLIW